MMQEQVHAHKKANDDGTVVVHVNGLVITNIGTTIVDREVQEVLLGAETPRVVLNLSNVSYLDSFSFGWIMRIYREIRQKGGEFALCCPNEDILYLFEVTDFSRVVPAYHTEKDAREALITGNQSKRIVYI